MSKSTRNSKSRRSERKKGGRKTNAGRIFIFAFSFVVVLILGLYGLYKLKKYIPSGESTPAVTTQKMSTAVKEADRIIAGAFFDLGISIKDIESKKAYKRAEGGIKWEYSDVRVSTPEGVGGKKITNVFKKSFAAKKSYELGFEGSGDSLTAELKSYGFKTHRIKFEPESGKSPPAEIAKEKEGGAEEKPGVKKEPGPAKEPVVAVERSQIREGGSSRPRIAIIVDDIGMSKWPVDKLVGLPDPVTFSILPDLPYSAYAAEAARKKGWDIMLHLPMEPMESSGYTGTDAGEGALLVGLSKEAIMAQLDKDLSAVPYIKGVNNHMGSKFMENEELMRMVLEKIKGRGLFFVDSLTSSGSVGYKTALNMGMKTGKRDVFLDNSSKEASYVKSQIEKLIEMSEKNGYAIGICHPYPGTVQALAEMMPKISDRVDIVSVSSVLSGGRELSER